MQRLLGVISLFIIQWAAAQQAILVNNNQPRLDITGKIVDAHDGRIIRFGKTFYWYGTKYGATNGFTTVNEYVCYSSPDLSKWKFEGALLKEKPNGVYYRPHVVYNARTKKYILWYNWYPKLWNGQFGVAVSDKPAGPFTIINDSVIVKQNAFGVGDLGVFVDDDGKAYLSYNTITNHKVSVERLTDDYTASTLRGSEFIAAHCEAGSMFKRNGSYYLLTDYTCCFCTQGSGAKVFTANSPLGPYTFRQNINRHAGQLAPLLNDGNINDNFFETLEAKQKNAIEIKFKKNIKPGTITLYQFTGNRNGQCGEVENPILHEPILTYGFSIDYFYDGERKTIPTQQPVVKKVSQQIIYQFTLAPVLMEKIRLTPVYKDSLSVIQVAEVLFGTREKYTVYKTGNSEGKPVIPAQQTYVMELISARGRQFIWMGDLWGSASDNIKGYDYQFWSAPLQFYKNGLIRSLEWTDQWSLQ